MSVGRATAVLIAIVVALTTISLPAGSDFDSASIPPSYEIPQSERTLLLTPVFEGDETLDMIFGFERLYHTKNLMESHGNRIVVSDSVPPKMPFDIYEAVQHVIGPDCFVEPEMVPTDAVDIRCDCEVEDTDFLRELSESIRPVDRKLSEEIDLVIMFRELYSSYLTYERIFEVYYMPEEENEESDNDNTVVLEDESSETEPPVAIIHRSAPFFKEVLSEPGIAFDIALSQGACSGPIF